MPQQKNHNSGQRDKWITTIGIFKLIKAALLIIVAIGGLKLLHKDLGAVVRHWVDVLNADPKNRVIRALLEKVARLEPRKVELMSIGTFVYAGLFLIEGIGLVLQKRWAEYVTIFITGSFLPFEIYELTRHFTPVKIVVIVLNAAIVWYLVWKLRHGQREHHGVPRHATA